MIYKTGTNLADHDWNIDNCNELRRGKLRGIKPNRFRNLHLIIFNKKMVGEIVGGI